MFAHEKGGVSAVGPARPRACTARAQRRAPPPPPPVSPVQNQLRELWTAFGASCDYLTGVPFPAEDVAGLLEEFPAMRQRVTWLVESGPWTCGHTARPAAPKLGTAIKGLSHVALMGPARGVPSNHRDSGDSGRRGCRC